MQQILSNGRASVVPKSKLAREVRASSEKDPDLYMWELLFFGMIDKNTMAGMRGFVLDPRQWGGRMKARGFPSPLHARAYPTYGQQVQAEKAELGKRWGRAAAVADRQLWTDKCAGASKHAGASTLAQACRKTTQQATGVAATQTEVIPATSAKTTNRFKQQKREKTGRYKNTGKVPKKRMAQIARWREEAKKRKEPISKLGKTLLTAEKQLKQAASHLGKLKRQAEKLKQGARTKRTRR